MSDDGWSVIQTTAAPMNVSVAAPILSRCADIPMSEASMKAHASRGVVLRLLQRSQAEETARELTSVGIPATSAPDSFTFPPPRPMLIRQATANEQLLMLPRGFTGVTSSLPWQSVKVVAAGRVTETETHQVSGGRNRTAALVRTAVQLSTGIPLPRPPNTTRVVEEQDTRDYLDILAGDPIEHYRLDGGKFNYASLIPEPSPAAEANFCRVLQGMLQMASDAATNVTPDCINSTGAVELPEFADPHLFDHVVTWLMTLSRLGLAGTSHTRVR